ncbi:MAG: hypothetical protein CMM47_03650 [Rhodospirillaceae bacterium]|nr:hypothetical protein [Rhodospirillaceae bacterium]
MGTREGFRGELRMDGAIEMPAGALSLRGIIVLYGFAFLARQAYQFNCLQTPLIQLNVIRQAGDW